jgi:hypothetical protein
MSGKVRPDKQKKEVRFYDPPNVLREKVGTGGFDPVMLERAEEFIDQHQVDFTPTANDILKRLNKAISKAKKAPKADKEIVDSISGPIMELKANGSMFHYALVSEIASVILNFLENVEELNEDGFDIIDVHQKTLEAILASGLTGDGGREGRALAQELYQACQRYKKKYRIVLDF